ncbi:uncharacterized protein [Pseudorasbora parva]|uniref:uncharacterized protein n=1 Tax=Pseudorasbora parva TaxID=51549 RepID=UPI00351ED677
MEDDKSQSASSRRSVTSSMSTVSMAAAKARAKAEAAQARASFAKKEMEIKIEKARLEATLDAMEREREAEAAMAEAAVMEAAVADLEVKRSHHSASIHLPQQSPRQRTEEYVKQHSEPSDTVPTKDNAKTELPQNLEDEKEKGPSSQRYRVLSSWNAGHYRGSETVEQSYPIFPQSSHSLPHHSKSPAAPIHHPSRNTNQATHHSSHDAATYDLAKFLARNQLVTSGLNKFDDRPENYLAWKSSFLNAIKNLDLTAGEEFDLLITWLGKDSADHARRIKSVNVRNLPAGLEVIWERLDVTYGSPEAIEKALFTKIETFPRISTKDHHRLRELGDLLLEIEAAKGGGDLPGLTYLDTARGVNPIVQKLPFGLQEKWMMQGSHYKYTYGVSFPPFSFFVEFVCAEARARNDPSFNFPSLSISPGERNRYSESHTHVHKPVLVHKTDVMPSFNLSHERNLQRATNETDKQCPIHRKPHPLKKCRSFREKPLEERKRIVKELSICFRCCSSNKHMARNCDVSIKCSECGSDKHLAALHPGPAPWCSASTPPTLHGGEAEENCDGDVSSKCTKVCGKGVSEKSCSKICLVKVYPAGGPDQGRRIYAIIDEQSNRSLARSEFFDMFKVQGSSSSYTLKTCAGVVQATGRRAHGFIIESADGEINFPLPTLIECNSMPDNRDEIPSAVAALHHSHLKVIVDKIPPIDPNAEILLLLGRDIIRAHKVRKQLNGPHDAPYAQKLDLGWVIVGNVCLGKCHKPSSVDCMRTHILENGRPSYFRPCNNHIVLKESFGEKIQFQKSSHLPLCQESLSSCRLGQSVFQQTKDDNKSAPSVEDQLFLDIMEKEFFKDSSNSWVAPLPFRKPRRRLPNNREYAKRRFMSLRRNLDKRPKMRDDFTEFMQRILDNNHAELAPPLLDGQESWYLPSFGVYHPKKPDQIRVVFDSSAQFDGVSLNDVLLSGPDLNNSLLGVLIRFRKDPVAITADIQQMFHCFLVREDCRDVLRFLWHRDNDLTKEVVDYRMRVHVFGNSPSPAVAIYGIRKAAKEEEKEYGSDVRKFVEEDFYVDDALKSFPTEEEAIDVLKRAQDALAASNLRLHKIAANRAKVMDAFPNEDLAKDIKCLDLSTDDLPDQRSLGVQWNLTSDTFTFQVPDTEKPYTRRGVLSTVNSLFDPLGFLAPITIQGRLLLRELSSQTHEWDTPLPESRHEEWTRWCRSLQDLRSLNIPRTYVSIPLSEAENTEICVFSDASMKAISAVAYLRVSRQNGNTEVGFILGKARLAPKPDLSVPRLELCAAVLAVELAELITEEIHLKPDRIGFYTDSRVVLGYIYNESRRFQVYVSNRVQRIRQSTQPEQWRYVSSEQNPADHGSRSVPSAKLEATTWLTGPSFLHYPPEQLSESPSSYNLIDPDTDVEVRAEIKALSTHVNLNQLGTRRFEQFSEWRTVVRAIARLQHIAHCFTGTNDDSQCTGWHLCPNGLSVSDLLKAEKIIIKSVQHEVYSNELRRISSKGDIPSHSPLLKLNPIIDSNGLLRVGGRIGQAELGEKETNPLIIPAHHHITVLLVRHFHERVQHQGRHLTEGNIRSNGFWIIGAKRCITGIIQKCVICRKLRGKIEEQQMADLPAERLQMDPPFSFVGLDVFGPWEVISRRTRGGQANSKRWAVLFTCMCTRGVHIEVIESMTSSSLINALRRFFSIRGPAKQLRSDCGTNFVGASRELKMAEKEQTEVREYLLDQRCSWVFNPPHSSHMGGAWERMIGITRRILDSMLLENRYTQLTHEVLVTFMSEVTAIINARPLVPVSTDPEFPFILTPSMLLTQKAGSVPTPQEGFSKKDMLQCQWKRVQTLAEAFWSRWRKEYLGTLQSRSKWFHKHRNIKEGDIVLLKDKQVKRNEWPMGIIVKSVPSADGMVRKVEVKTVQHGITRIYHRPISELVYLLSSDQAV